MVINNFIPFNLFDMTPKKIHKFRERRRDERRNFMNSIKTAAKNISNCKDPKIIEDMVEELKKDIEKSIAEYKKSSDILNVTGWTGIKTLVFPVLTDVIGKFMSIGSTSLKILSVAGLSIGLINGIAETNHKQNKLSKESDFSYLVHLNNRLHNVYQGYDYNWYLCRKMEEFIND